MYAHQARLAAAILALPTTTSIRKHATKVDSLQLGQDRADAARKRKSRDERTGMGTSKIATPRKALGSARVKPGWSRGDEIYFGPGHAANEAQAGNRKRTGTNTWKDVKVQPVKSGRRNK